MKIVMSGASGFIGRHLTRVLESAGHELRPLVRGGFPSSVRGAIAWDPGRGLLDPAELSGVDAVINLAGEPIAQRWTLARKERIRTSRIQATQTIVRAMQGARPAPPVLLSGSAIGYYGDCGDEQLDEESAQGNDYLGTVAGEWERATHAARDAGLRVVLMRTGLVLAVDGGALAKMLPPFRIGIGGPMGSGTQWMSWITREDYSRAVLFLLGAPVAGPVNLVSPTPVRNAEFASALAQALRRPAVLRLPSTVLTLVFGEMARGTLLASQRVAPRRLDELGFQWRSPVLVEALRSVLLDA
jgi:uncharacterized protein